MKIFGLLLYAPLILQTAVWPLVRPAFRFFLHLDIVGMQNLSGLEKGKGIIFVANHSSETDAIVVPASLPFLSSHMPMFYVARPRAFYKNSSWRQVFYGGTFFKLWGAYPAIAGHHDYEYSLQVHLELLKLGKSLLIFPEGRRTVTGNIMVNEARGGAAFMANSLSLPIIPIAISGLYKMTLTDFLHRKRTVRIIFGKPIYKAALMKGITASGEGDNVYKAAMRQVLRHIALMETFGDDVPDSISAISLAIKPSASKALK